MQLPFPALSLVVSAYFLGAIPFGLVVSTLKGINLREIGSGNIGASNVYRAMGLKWAGVVFFLDGLKGFLPTAMAIHFYPNHPIFHVFIGLLTVVGHSFPIFARFRGGKGAATGVGVLLGLHPLTFLCVAPVVIAIIAATRMVSAASITGAVLTPILLILFHAPRPYWILAVVIAAVIIFRHRSNIQRLLAGTENKV